MDALLAIEGHWRVASSPRRRPGNYGYQGLDSARTGPTALGLLTELGWTEVAVPSGQADAVHVAGSAAVTPRGMVARIGQSASAVVLDASFDAEDRCRFVMATAGSAIVNQPHADPVKIRSGQAILIPEIVGTTLEVHGEFHRFECVTTLECATDGGRIPVRRGYPYAYTREAGAPFAALVNAYLRGGARPASRSLLYVQAAIEGTVAALLADVSDHHGAGLTPKEAQLVVRAAEIVDEHVSARRRLSVAALAETLGVSRVWLHRVFAKYGTTPSEFIRSAAESP